MKKIELLVPAGSPDALHAAIRYGADAVYLGMTRFNARNRAQNFDGEALADGVLLCHDHGVGVYVTMNTLIFDEEMDAALRDADTAITCGCDALIVQDLGFANQVRQRFPEIPLHASTQMTLSDSRSITWVQSVLQLQRVILPREISLAEIRVLKEKTSVELEMFIHGALCISYSGQCTASRFMGGRSANRGACAQPCRHAYNLILDGSEIDAQARHWLSPKDLCLFDRLPDLINSGICSLKIEGRMKQPEYVAAVTSCYRRALDAALAVRPCPEDVKEDASMLSLSYARSVGSGYIDGDNHKQLVDERVPGKAGLPVGTIARQQGHRIFIKNTHALSAGDGIAFGLPDEKGRRKGGRIFTAQAIAHSDLTEVTLYRSSRSAETPEFDAGTPVWLTSRPSWSERWDTGTKSRLPFREVPVRFELTVKPEAKPVLRATDSMGRTAIATGSKELETARARPLRKEKVVEQLSRLGETMFSVEAIAMNDGVNELEESPAMLPVSELNQLRREVCEHLQKQHFPRRITPLEQPQVETVVTPDDALPGLSILVRSAEQISPLLTCMKELEMTSATIIMDFSSTEDLADGQNAIREAGLLSGLTTPRAMCDQHEKTVIKRLDLLPDVMLIRSTGAWRLCREHHTKPLYIGDMSLNIVNQFAADTWLQQGLHRLTPGVDADEIQLMDLIVSQPARWEIPIYFHPLFFYTQYCLYSVHAGNGKGYPSCQHSCRNHQITLRDRTGLNLSALRDETGRLQIIGEAAEERWNSMFRLPEGCAVRIELLDESPSQIKTMLNHYDDACSNR